MNKQTLNIKDFDKSGNIITECDISEVTRIDFGGAQITTSPDFSKCENLEWLERSKIQITTPLAVTQCERLKRIDLSDWGRAHKRAVNLPSLSVDARIYACLAIIGLVIALLISRL